MPERSGVLFACSNDGCDYETLLFPSSSKQREQWLCGYDSPRVICPECGSTKARLSDLFTSNPDEVSLDAPGEGLVVVGDE